MIKLHLPFEVLSRKRGHFLLYLIPTPHRQPRDIDFFLFNFFFLAAAK